MRSLPSALARINWSSDRPAALMALGAWLAAPVPAGSTLVASAPVAALAVTAAVLVLATLRAALAALRATLAALRATLAALRATLAALRGTLAPEPLRVASVAASAAVAPAGPVAVAELLAAGLASDGHLGRLGAAKESLKPAEESPGWCLGRRGVVIGRDGLIATRALIELRAPAAGTPQA